MLLSNGPQKKGAPRVIQSAGAATTANLLFSTPDIRHNRTTNSTSASPTRCAARMDAATRIRSLTPAIKSGLTGYGRTCSCAGILFHWMVGYFGSARSASSAQLQRLVQPDRGRFRPMPFPLSLTRLTVLTLLWNRLSHMAVILIVRVPNRPSRPKTISNSECAEEGLRPPQPASKCAGDSSASWTGWCRPARGRMRFPSIARGRP